jgi:hypothetical protein
MLVTWFSAIRDEPCPDVGMWMVEPDLDADGEREMSVIHLDSILRATPVCGDDPVPRHFKYTEKSRLSKKHPKHLGHYSRDQDV